MMKMNLKLSLCSLFFVAGTSFASAQTATLNPTGDAFVSSSNSTNNYGGAGALAVSANGLPKGEFDSVLSFDLGSTKTSFDTLYGVGQWSIQSIKLTLNAAVPNNPIFNGNGSPSVNTAGQFLIKSLQNGSFTEGTGMPSSPGVTGITSSTLAGLLGGSDETLGTFTFSGGTSGTQVYTLGLMPNFSGKVLSGSVINFELAPADSSVSYLFNSRNFVTPASRPILTISVVPEPLGTLLLLPALAFLLAVGWFRNRRAGS